MAPSWARKIRGLLGSFPRNWDRVKAEAMGALKHIEGHPLGNVPENQGLRSLTLSKTCSPTVPQFLHLKFCAFILQIFTIYFLHVRHWFRPWECEFNRAKFLTSRGLNFSKGEKKSTNK